MAALENLSIKRLVFVFIGSPLLGSFVWAVFNPPAGWENVLFRFIHGVLVAPVSLFVMVMRPDKIQSWAYIGVTFLLLSWIAIRLPRSSVGGYGG